MFLTHSLILGDNQTQYNIIITSYEYFKDLLKEFCEKIREKIDYHSIRSVLRTPKDIVYTIGPRAENARQISCSHPA